MSANGIIGFTANTGVRAATLIQVLYFLAERGIQYNCTVTKYVEAPKQYKDNPSTLVAHEAFIVCKIVDGKDIEIVEQAREMI